MQAEVITACSRRGITYKLIGIDHGMIVFKQAFRLGEGFMFNKPGNSLSNQQLAIMPLPLSHILVTPGWWRKNVFARFPSNRFLKKRVPRDSHDTSSTFRGIVISRTRSVSDTKKIHNKSGDNFIVVKLLSGLMHCLINVCSKRFIPAVEATF